ncbi:MAG: hypothetical protein IKA32_11295, partial [Lentisphaeria bacterium]|nr:hypothetical protein [Lentisphaeria bacterium]
RDLAFENISIESESSPVAIICDPGITLRGIRNFFFSGIRIKAKHPVLLEGNVSTVLENICFHRVGGVIDRETPLVTKFVRDLELDHFKISAATGEPEVFARKKGSSWETE